MLYKYKFQKSYLLLKREVSRKKTKRTAILQMNDPIIDEAKVPFFNTC